VSAPPRRLPMAALVFALVASLGLTSVLTRPQLGTLGGVTDEYFALGARLWANGTLGLSADEPSALRAPGYPALVAATLRVALGDPASVDLRAVHVRGQRAVGVMQAMVLALGAALLFAWLATRVDATLAAALAVAFGTGPYVLVAAGLLHYGPVHMTLMVAGCWLLDRAVAAPSARRLALAGALWGLAALVRPVTVLLPFFVLLALLWARTPARAALRHTLVLAAAMGAVLVPWTARNLHVTNRLVLVTNNNWVTLWGQTVRPLPHDPNRYVWFDLYAADLMPVISRVTGNLAFDYEQYVRRLGEIEDAFRAEALSNLRRQPAVYAGNVARTAASLLVEPTPVLLAAFRQVRLDEASLRGPYGVVAVPQGWFVRGEPQPTLPPVLHVASNLLVYGWLVLAGAGALVALRRRTPAGLALLAVGGCVLTTHALVFMHLMHYYVRWPIAAGLAALALQELASRGPREARAARLGAGLLATLSVAVSAALI
jgi:hypothetical protein